jgi:hypothetical protein
MVSTEWYRRKGTIHCRGANDSKICRMDSRFSIYTYIVGNQTNEGEITNIPSSRKEPEGSGCIEQTAKNLLFYFFGVIKLVAAVFGYQDGFINCSFGLHVQL